jgi:hypothetical protein
MRLKAFVVTCVVACCLSFSGDPALAGSLGEALRAYTGKPIRVQFRLIPAEARGGYLTEIGADYLVIQAPFRDDMPNVTAPLIIPFNAILFVAPLPER